MADSKLIAFVATQNSARALKFYRDTLGLSLVSDDPFAIVFDDNGTMLRVQKVQPVQPAQYTALGWSVPDIYARIRELTDRGVHFEKFPGLPQDGHCVWAAPSGAKVAWFKDPDGNILSLTEFPP